MAGHSLIPSYIFLLYLYIYIYAQYIIKLASKAERENTFLLFIKSIRDDDLLLY